MSQLSIFDEIEKAEAERLAAERIERDKPVTCTHCGEVSPNRYLWETNHGKPKFHDMPGVCVKHWFMFNQARWAWGDTARTWLFEHGFAWPTPEEEWVK